MMSSSLYQTLAVAKQHQRELFNDQNQLRSTKFKYV